MRGRRLPPRTKAPAPGKAREDYVAGLTDVLNGIAYDPKNKRLFVTGKLWPKLFEIELIRKPHEAKDN